MSHQRNGDYKTPKDEWGTPQWLFDLLDQEFHFDCDAAADENNTKCHWYLGEDYAHRKEDSTKIDWMQTLFQDGLSQNYCKTFFLNPPYSAGNIDKFMQKAYEESLNGAIVVCLVPVASDVGWWHNYVMKAQEIRFIKGRVKFVGYDAEGKQIKNSPTFSSCVVIFDKKMIRICPYTGLPLIGKTIEQPKNIKIELDYRCNPDHGCPRNPKPEHPCPSICGICVSLQRVPT